MSEQENIVTVRGDVEVIITYEDGRVEKKEWHNNILKKGREAIASSLANKIGDEFNFYVARMLFGDGGTNGGIPKLVTADRNGLFGTTRANKSVTRTINPSLPSQIVFTTVLGKGDANGFALNEMALQLNTGDLYSMATFADLNKTNSISMTWNWRITII
jgi:hypothetical protein